ncbi:MAG: hypothetical protein K0Q72_3650 [Armatimonadetes bacterium]|jgi:hypothetical protein|nr:hypothetical protein [Armatimonadota bacterium]
MVVLSGERRNKRRRRAGTGTGEGVLANVICSEQASASLETLPSVARGGVEQRLDYLRDMPRMYAMSTDERFPGCRTFWVDPCYRVFYMVAAGADDIYVVAIVEEEVDDAGLGLDF